MSFGAGASVTAVRSLALNSTTPSQVVGSFQLLTSSTLLLGSQLSVAAGFQLAPSTNATVRLSGSAVQAGAVLSGANIGMQA